MVFSSHVFLFYFLPLSLALYYLMPRGGKHLLLTLVSYVFYGWANPFFMMLMLVSTLIDYVCGLAVTGQFRRAAWRQPVPMLAPGGHRSRGQTAAMIVSLCSNLALLGFFKYFNFATENWDAAASAMGLPGLQLDLAFKVTLPLGISFYTFQSMSYAIDVYRGDARAIRNFIDYACYVSMFPQLVAGPIIRFQEVADQLNHRTYTVEKFARGVAFFCLGMAKKVILANACGKVADTAFDAAGVGMLDSWVGVIGYSFQIYYDFSAYSDMAIGLGLMTGFTFAKNFDSPYLSQSITEFWRRWHISLSTWLKDYLYIPLGGNRKGERRTYINLAMVMVLGGLWHGASWNFVIWGAIHGTMLAVERLQGKQSFYNRLPGTLRMVVTFGIVCFTWVFFRCDDLPTALRYCGSMLGLNGPLGGAAAIDGIAYQPYYVFMLLLAGGIVWLAPQTWDFTRRITVPRLALLFCAFLVAVAALTTQGFNPFIYFIF